MQQIYESARLRVGTFEAEMIRARVEEKRVKIVKRDCLICENAFKATGRFNRVCSNCAQTLQSRAFAIYV